MKNKIDLKRLSLLITREFALNKKNVLIMISSMTFASMLVTYLLPHHYQVGLEIWKHYQMYPQVVALYCIVVSAYSFIELNSSDRNIEFIMLPSSTLEKYLTKFIYSTLGYILMAGFALSITSIFVIILNAGNPSDFKGYFTYLQKQNLIILFQAYLIFQSIFFFGGVYFRKMELVKTFLTAVGLFVILYLLEMFLSEVLAFKKVGVHFDIPQQYLEIRNNTGEFLTFPSRDKLQEFILNIRRIIIFIGLYIIPFFFWLLSYLRLKENEVTDGV